MKIFFFLFPLFFSLSVLAIPIPYYQEKEFAGHVFEFGIDPKQPTEKHRTAMSISVREKETGNVIEVESFWMTISRGDEMIFYTSDLKTRKWEKIVFVFSFPEEGAYTVDFGFEKEGGKISTQFEVGVGGESSLARFLFAGFGGAAAGFIIGYIVRWFLKK